MLRLELGCLDSGLERLGCGRFERPERSLVRLSELFERQ